jgi:hypothetical protein
VPAAVRREILNPGAAAGTRKGLLNPAARRSIIGAPRSCIGQPIRSAKYLTLAVPNVRERDQDPLMERHAAGIAILGLGENNVTAGEINAVPIEP